MRIAIKPYGGEYAVLCDDSLTGSPHAGLAIVQRQVTGSIAPHKGDSALPLGRGNWLQEVSFTGFRGGFADEAAAEAFARRHRATLPDGGVMRFDDGDGDVDPDYVAHAVPAEIETTVEGRACTVRYRFLCSEFTTTDPDPET